MKTNIGRIGFLVTFAIGWAGIYWLPLVFVSMALTGLWFIHCVERDIEALAREDKEDDT